MIPLPKKQTILITGTSSGFGMLTAARLASKGHQVIAAMRNPGKQNVLLKEVKKRGGAVEVIYLDVTKPETIKKAFEKIVTKYEHLDVLINNAGYGIGGFFEDLTEDEIRLQMETNFFGVQNVTREALHIMRPRRSGKIINISSVAGFSTSPAFSAYNASKWALEAFSESLHHELKLFNIGVFLIEPGTYNTKIFHENARYAKHFDDQKSPYYPYSQKLKTRVLNYVTKDCHKDPEDIPALIESIIDGRRKSFRNIPDIEGKMLYALRKFLPFPIYSRMIQKALAI